MKGFVMTLIVISYILLIVALATSLHNSHLSLERSLLEPQPLLYSAAFFDDVGYDVNEIAGPEISIIQGNESVGISIHEMLPKNNYTEELENYEDFIEGAFAHANVSADFSSLTNGTLELYINEEYLYQNQYNGDNEILFKSISGGTNVSEYSINITMWKIRKSVENFEWDDGEPGAINVTLIYSDRNGTEIASGQLDPSEVNYFKIVYEGNETPQVEIKIGSVGGSTGAFWIREYNTSIDFSFHADVPLQDYDGGFGYYYDAVLNYTMADVSKTGQIGR